jgi:DNA-binding MarR family transcriptional regulator
VVLVSLTAKGKKVIEALHEQRREQWRVILAGLGPDEQKQLLDAFETILRLLRQIDEPHEAAEGRGPKPNA